MIQQIADKYQKLTAAVLLTVCYTTMILPTQALASRKADKNTKSFYTSYYSDKKPSKNLLPNNNLIANTSNKAVNNNTAKRVAKLTTIKKFNSPTIGGPSQPEMSAFKSVGTDNMVNLFTGDFSYNIPLLDVGGYPVNIFYDGGVGMEQEASWVGLGWNINPGNVNRNMRGVPDDFNGEDKLKQTQMIKPNVTWGVNLGADAELLGIDGLKIGANFGVSVNNYLGPALELGVKGNVSLSLIPKVSSEKAPLKLGIGGSINASSRTGVTFSPSISLTANVKKINENASLGFGVRAATSYNSRSGVKAIQISEQMSMNLTKVKGSNDCWNYTTSNEKSSVTLGATTISFVKPSYIPSMRMSLTNTAGAGRFELGGGIFGFKGSLEGEVYKQKSEVAQADQVQIKPMVGYLYLQNANTNPHAVMDFTRFNDNEVTPTTPIISVPQYSYDVFAIQGEGTGGSIRAYRNDDSYVRDNYTLSKDKSWSAGADIAPPGHFGGNFSSIKTPSTSGEWKSGNNIKSLGGFKTANGIQENVYFRNPGETSVLQENQYAKIGETNLVRYKLGGTGSSPSVNPILEKFSKAGYKNGEVNMMAAINPTARKKRTQVISFLNAEEASVAGLDKKIKNYDGNTILSASNNLNFTEIDRVGGDRKKHHISQINVTEGSGQRYVYGIPVYNTIQKDFTFTVANNAESSDGKVSTNSNEATTLHSGSKDGYLQITETPAYAHSFLLSGLLSPDYVDLTGNGITEDDLGGAVKFNYTKINAVSRWQTPLSSSSLQANFNKGKLTENKDDKGFISYGERESWYVHSIESKTMIALFKLENREDSKGVDGQLGLLQSTDNSAQRLKQIDLYSKADLKKNGITGAKPIKTVHFEYSYALCTGTPNNASGNGKLTLDKIYFTFNGQNRASKNQYVFNYGSTATENPPYQFNGNDRWGTYKPSSQNPAVTSTPDYPYNNLKNSDYPYTKQDKTTVDQNAGAWMLKKILLPSGGQMEVTYESDDYAFVQNKRAAVMMKVVGFGNTATGYNNRLYNVAGTGFVENNYAFIQVPEACANKQEVLEKYLKGIEQLSFKLAVNMPKGIESLNSYAVLDGDNYGLYTADATNKTIWVKLKNVDGLSPLSLTAVEFLREQLPGQAFKGYDVSESSGLAQVGEMLIGLLDGLKNATKSPVKAIREAGKAQTVELSKCFVRLNDPDGFKYGGGYRVKSVRLKDNWKKMNQNQLYTSVYGQDYDYTTTETFNGVQRTISSGVASYEPSLGGDENPFQTMIQISNTVPLGPASYGSIEMPVMDAFFPAPNVGYSKVTVRSIKKGMQDPSKKSRSGIGKQVSEYYTAKDFPVYYNHTNFDVNSEKKASVNSSTAFFYKFAFDARALSQGFIVETNDMHGKLKSQASYAENDEKTPINYTQNFYRNTGAKGMDEKFDFVFANEGGVIREGNMGIDIELMTDTREFSVKGTSFEIQGQVDLFPVGLPFWLPFIWPVGGNTENTYRAVTTTKVISYHSILDSVLVIDKGSQVSTKNMVYDAETGEVIVNRTNNEFKQPIYSTNYPAYWAYSGMGLAYKNIDAVYKNVNFRDGKIISNNVPLEDLESGDELYIIEESALTDNCAIKTLNQSGASVIWAFDRNKDGSGLTNPIRDFYFMDNDGRLYSKNNVTFRIIRSGKRNLLSAKVSSFTSQIVPIVADKLTINNSRNVVNASAMQYWEKWQTDNDVILKYKLVYNSATCSYNEVLDCAGYLDKKLNPYRKGMLGVFKSKESRVFYGNRKEINPTAQTAISKNGYLDNFTSFWSFNFANNLAPAYANTNWVWNSQITKTNAKGLELETKDALGIYTAAQYGFNKTTPVGIANNSRYHEMFVEGFEDADYNESLNQTNFNPCIIKHFDLSTTSGAQLTNTATHTGKTALMVNGYATKNVPIKTSIPEDYLFTYPTDVGDGSLYEEGGNINWSWFFPWNQNSNVLQTYFGGGGVNINVSPIDTVIYNYGSTTRSHSFDGATEHYIQATQAGYYDLTINYYVPYTGINGGGYNVGIFARIVDLYGNQIGYVYLGEEPSQGTGIASAQVYICSPGIYSVVTTVTGNFSYSCENLSCNVQVAHDYIFNTQVSINTGSYKTTNMQNGCTFNKPIPSTADMLNPTFSITPGKKMLLSAWVKEDCTTPCLKNDYTNSNIEIWANGQNLGATTIKRTGSIIEGWQKIEGEFTVPLGTSATTAEIRFINTNSAPMYVDDIRIHPYNANMKSYVYDPVNLRLTAELDANNYASFYEYDDEGTLIRTKVETKEGIKTVTETRSAKQKNITTFQ